MTNQELYNEIRARKIVPTFTRIGNLYISSALAMQIKGADTMLPAVSSAFSGRTFGNEFSVFLEWFPLNKS